MSKESGEFCGIPNSELQQCAKDLGVTSVNGLQYYWWRDTYLPQQRKEFLESHPEAQQILNNIYSAPIESWMDLFIKK